METTERVHRRRSEVFFKEVRGALLMVAALIATVTFTAGIYPPGGFWQDDDSQGKHTAGKPIMVDKNKAKYEKFMSRNTHAFIQSLLLTMLLMVSYGTTNHALLVALVCCVGVSLLTTLVLMGLPYGTESSGLLVESATKDIIHYALVYLGVLSVVILVTWIFSCLTKRAAAKKSAAYRMEAGMDAHL